MFKVSPPRYKMFVDAQRCSWMLLNGHKGQPRGFLGQSRYASFLRETGLNNPQSWRKKIMLCSLDCWPCLSSLLLLSLEQGNEQRP